MKKKCVFVLLTSTVIASAARCAANISAPYAEENSAITQEGKNMETDIEPESVKKSEHTENAPDDTQRNLEECFTLIGKDDIAAAGLLDGGKENIAGDGVTKIGRIYSVKLFGEETEAGSLYDENNCVYTITMQLKNPDASVYAEQLQKIYGEPITDDTPSETGATWKSWNIGDIQLRLYQEYELTSLEITKRPDTDSLFTGWLPQSVEQIMSETRPNELLKQAIIDYYEIPEEFWEQTKYYYNYVDLNGDGADEIFAVIIGSYTSGSGGNSALWCREYEGTIEIYQAFTLVNTPIIITRQSANGQEYGAKGLVLQRSGGGAATEIVQLTYSDGIYTNVADAPVLENMEDIQGTAIICNNLISDMESGNFLTLAD